MLDETLIHNYCHLFLNHQNASPAETTPENFGVKSQDKPTATDVCAILHQFIATPNNRTYFSSATVLKENRLTPASTIGSSVDEDDDK